jgi:hypothetical protein
VSRQGLGKKIGDRRVFSQSDVQKLLKGSKKSSPKKKPKAPSKKTSRKATKPKQIAVVKTETTSSSQSLIAAEPTQRSFWNRLFGGRREKEKISLMDAKMTK